MKTKLFSPLRLMAVVMLLMPGGVQPMAAQAQPGTTATVVVNTTTDENDHSCTDGDCSLRDAIETAADGDTINFSVTGTITLNLGVLGAGVAKDLAITGPGAASLAISGNNSSGVFLINRNVTISGLTVRDGKAVRGFGGGLSTNGTLTLVNSIVMSNVAEYGGAIANITTRLRMSTRLRL